LLALQGIVFRLDRVVADLVVIAVVADGGGKLRLMFETVFPIVFEEGVEGLAILLDGDGRGRGSRRGRLSGEAGSQQGKRGEHGGKERESSQRKDLVVKSTLR